MVKVKYLNTLNTTNINMETIEKSEQINELAKSLIEFKKKCPAIDLNSTVKVTTKTGGSYTFDYADLPHIKAICDPILSEVGLVVTQLPIGEGLLYTMLMHESGQYIAGVTSIGKVDNKTSQEYGSAITFFKRYSYCAITGIVADKDDDANTADGNSAQYIVDKKIIDEIAKTGTQDELKAVFEKYKNLHRNNEFIKLVKEKKELL